MGRDLRVGGVLVCVYMCVRVGGWGGWGVEAEKPLTFNGRVRERKEGKGELRMPFSLSGLLPVFLYRSTTCLSILFIYLSLFFSFSLNRPHIWFGPTPPCPPKSPLTTLQQLSNALFGVFAVPCCYSPCEGCPPYRQHAHRQMHSHPTFFIPTPALDYVLQGYIWHFAYTEAWGQN